MRPYPSAMMLGGKGGLGSTAVVWDTTTDGRDGTVGTTPSYSGGNLIAAANSLASTNQTIRALAAYGKTTGKWYFEAKLNVQSSGGGNNGIGIQGTVATQNMAGQGYLGQSYGNAQIGYYAFGGVYRNGTNIASMAACNTTDRIGVAFDAGALTVQFYKNGVANGSPFSVNSGPAYVPAGNFFTSGDQITILSALAYLPSGFLPWS